MSDAELAKMEAKLKEWWNNLPALRLQPVPQGYLKTALQNIQALRKVVRS